MALYDEGLHWADADLAPLFELLRKTGLDEKTILVFNADHGEEFDEHGVISHGQTYYDGVVRTPLVIAAPKTPAAGTAVSELVQNSTSLRRFWTWSASSVRRAGAGAASHGRSPASRARPAPLRRPHSREGAWTFWIGSVQQAENKFILVTPQDRMLFDLASDPGEKKNLAMAEAGRDSVRTLYHVLMKHLGGPSAQVASGGTGTPSYETWMKQVMGHYGLTEESDVVKELRSLGYLK